MTTATADQVELTERRERLINQLTGLKSQRDGIAADLAMAEQDWTAALRDGADVTLPAQRHRHREQELADLDRSIAQVSGWLADVDAEIATLQAREQLRRDTEAYGAELSTYSSSLAALSDAPSEAVAAVVTALHVLVSAVEAVRRTHAHLTVRAGQLRDQTAALDVAVDVDEPARWTSTLETHRETDLWTLCLALMQNRGDKNVLGELTSVVLRQRLRKE